MAKITFSNSNNDFYQSLKTSVEEYFTKNGIKKTGDWRLYIKTITLVATAVAMYSLFNKSRLVFDIARADIVSIGFIYPNIFW